MEWIDQGNGRAFCSWASSVGAMQMFKAVDLSGLTLRTEICPKLSRGLRRLGAAISGAVLRSKTSSANRHSM